MREVKFRGLSNCNSEWTYGNLVIVGDKYHITDQEECEEVSEYTLVSKKSVGQFTGVYDYTKNEIYEGDILQDMKNEGETKYKVVYEPYIACFCLVNIESPEYSMDLSKFQVKTKKLVVVSNVFDESAILKHKSNN